MAPYYYDDAVLTDSNAIFATADLAATLAHYKDVLGFDSTWTWGDPPTFGGASFGSVLVLFGLEPDLARRVQGHSHWFRVEDVDALYGLHREQGAKIVDPLQDRPWGVREYVVEDINGYRLRFAGNPSPPGRHSSDFPEGVTLARRKPTADEHRRIVAAAFSKEEKSSDFLENTWGGVVALSPEGAAIGTARIMEDARGWYSVWDVAVLPEWQGKGIGSAIMKEVLQAVREASPGALVYLFTVKEGFYDRLGFKTKSVSIRNA